MLSSVNAYEFHSFLQLSYRIYFLVACMDVALSGFLSRCLGSDPQTPRVGPQTPLAGPQIPLTCPQTPLAGRHPSGRPSFLWQALRPLWQALRPLWQALTPLGQALRPLSQALRPLWQAPDPFGRPSIPNG